MMELKKGSPRARKEFKQSLHREVGVRFGGGHEGNIIKMG
jgi:hypothetical protein